MSAPDRRKGLLLMIGAGLCWSLGGLIVRSVEVADPWTIVFWRALFMGLFVGVVLVAMHGRAAGVQVRGVGAAGLIAAICLALQIYFFILSLKNTTTANTFVLMSVSPLVTAVAGWLFLGERVHAATWAAIAVALAGILVMFGEGLVAAGAPSHWIGNLFALCVPLAYATQILFVRRIRAPGVAAPNLLPTILLAGIVAAVPALFLASTLAVSPRDLALLALMGCVQLGLGCLLMTLAVPHLRAAEMGLLAMIETILAPLWVWIGVGESPGATALAGGALILGALFVNGWIALRAEPRA
ncbi:MAG: DMT family transporter [Burkholderiales bacterium]|nr:DMT family transporter [Burkholderiales bacterium]